MAGSQPRTDPATFGRAVGQAKWRALLAGNYFTNARGQRCPDCYTRRACRNHFCLQCSVGGLCPTRFLQGGDHANHPRIQVYKVTGVLALRVHDLRGSQEVGAVRPALMNKSQLDPLQQYFENENLHYKFFPPNRLTPTNGLQRCHGCGLAIAETDTPNEGLYPVCSIQCLLDYALAQRRDAEQMLAAAQQRRAAQQRAGVQLLLDGAAAAVG